MDRLKKGRREKYQQKRGKKKSSDKKETAQRGEKLQKAENEKAWLEEREKGKQRRPGGSTASDPQEQDW